MSAFQMIAVLFGLFMLYVIHVHHRRAALTFIEVSFWFSTWSLFIVLTTFPELLSGIAGALQFSRVFDLLIVIALMVLSFVVIYSYLLQREIDLKIEELIRRQALSNHDRKKHGQK